VVAGAGQRGGPMLWPQWRHDGCVSEVDDDQLAALRRLLLVVHRLLEPEERLAKARAAT
jgi:hypothetical protein